MNKTLKEINNSDTFRHRLEIINLKSKDGVIIFNYDERFNKPI